AECSLELVRANALRVGLAERNPGRAGRAKFQSSQAPGFVVTMQLGGDILQRTSAQHDLLGSEFDLRGDRQMRNDDAERPQRRQRANRLSSIVPGEEPV